jgi:hypothetical protein
MGTIGCCWRVAGLGVMALILYKGYVNFGPGMLLLGQPIALVAALAVQRAILNAFPPKLEPYAGHRIWLKLD